MHEVATLGTHRAKRVSLRTYEEEEGKKREMPKKQSVPGTGLRRDGDMLEPM